MVAEVYANVGITAAKIAGEDPEIDRVANRLKVLAKSEAARNRKSGEFGDSIIVVRAKGRRGVTDRLVVATDPFAAVKEFGHVIRNEAGGPDLGYVKGLHAMSNAIKRLPEVSGD